MNPSYQRLVLSYILDVTVVAYLQAFKYTFGLCNPENKVGTSIPVYQCQEYLLYVISIVNQN